MRRKIQKENNTDFSKTDGNYQGANSGCILGLPTVKLLGKDKKKNPEEKRKDSRENKGNFKEQQQRIQ